MVTVCANVRPSFQPRKPARIAPTRGENAAISESVMRLICCFFCLPFVLRATAYRLPPIAYPLRLPKSSTLIDRRFLNSATRIASPMADSAAATVRMKNTNTWPARSPL